MQRPTSERCPRRTFRQIRVFQYSYSATPLEKQMGSTQRFMLRPETIESDKCKAEFGSLTAACILHCAHGLVLNAIFQLVLDRFMLNHSLYDTIPELFTSTQRGLD